MLNGLVPYLRVAWLWRYRLRSKPHTRLPSPNHLCQKEESPQHPAVIISKDSVQLRWKAARVPDIPLRGPMQGLTDRHNLNSSAGLQLEKH